MTEDIQELKEVVPEEIKSDTKPAGVEGGVEGGVVGGVVGGVQGGVVGGVLGGQLGGVRVFHHSELEPKKRVYPEYPEAAKELNLGDQRCLAVVFMDEEGVPYDVRRAAPHWAYDRVEFEVVTQTAGDNYARYLVRMAEMEQSMRIAEQALGTMPGGASGNQGSGGASAGGSGVVSCSSVVISAPALASMAAWWIFARIAKLFFGRSRNESSPSTR